MASNAVSKEDGQAFWATFMTATSLMAACELGDKTFFITSIMSLKKSKIAVLLGSISAMSVMTFVSIFVGLLTSNVPQWIIHYISVALFLLFGCKMIVDGYRMTEEDGMEEYEEAEEEIKKKENVTAKPGYLNRFLNKDVMVFLQVFSMIFVAEWGDRTQISTILLAAKQNFWAVAIGSCLGFSITSVMAVLGASVVMKIISVRKMTIVGGVVFLGFAFMQLCQ